MKVLLKLSFVADSNQLFIVVLEGEGGQGRVYRKLFITSIILFRKTRLIAATMGIEMLEIKESLKKRLEV